MNIAHTPGPWNVTDAFDNNYPMRRVRSLNSDGMVLAHINDIYDSEANARLIAAAPDMAEALIRFADAMTQRSYPELQGIACDAFAALAKAGLR